MQPSHLGTVRALALRLLDALPDIALACARSGGFGAAFASMGRELEQRVGVSPPRSERGSRPAEGARSLDEWFVEVSRHKPLVIEIDNAIHCDDGSLGFCVQLSQRAHEAALMLVVADRVGRERTLARGLGVWT